MDKEWIAACGLNCETCEIKLAQFDSGAAKTLVKWFKSQRWLAEEEGMPEVIERKMYCTGCRGSRDTHWSADCWILACCVDQYRLSNCSQCLKFPCNRLVAWSQGDASYREALETLKSLKESG